MGYPEYCYFVFNRRGLASRCDVMVRGSAVLDAVALSYGWGVLFAVAGLLYVDVLVVDTGFDDLFSGGAMVVLGDSTDESEWPMNLPAGTMF